MSQVHIISTSNNTPGIDYKILNYKSQLLLFFDLKKKISISSKYWQQIKDDIGKEKSYIAFLKNSYLVISNDYLQIGIDDLDISLRDTILMCPDILKDNDQNRAFIAICRKLKELEEESKKRLQNDFHKNFYEKLNKAAEEFKRFDLSSLDFLDDMRIEVRFPSANMEIIQKVKQHHLVDKEKTCQCMACVRVVLK